jgi:hypothetical protein
LGDGLTIPTIKNIVLVMKYLKEPHKWLDPLARHKHWKMDIRFGMWNVRSRCRTGSLKMTARELGKCKLDLVGAQEVRWEKGGTARAEDCSFLYGEGN